MKAHGVYDSAYGNTKAVADAVVQGLQPLHAAAVSVTEFNPATLSAGDLLVLGSPINVWRPTPERSGELEKAASWTKTLATALERKAPS